MLAVNTPEGQRLMEHQKAALDLFVRRFPNLKYQQTATVGESAGAVVDAIFFKNDIMFFCTEVKTRNITHDILKNKYSNEWLISLKKIDQARIICDLMQIPFWGFLYLQPEKKLLYIKIYDPLKKDFCCNMRIETKTTTGPILHDTKSEPCAFIKMCDAYIIEGDKCQI